MNKNLVTSLELSRTLEKLGVKQESEFYWIKNFHTNDPWKIGDKVDIGNNNDAISKGLEPWYTIGASAFLSGELGEMLPVSLTEKYHELNITRGGYQNEPDEVEIKEGKITNYKEKEMIFDWVIKYIEAYTDKTIHFKRADTLAESMGEMLKYLKENNLI